MRIANILFHTSGGMELNLAQSQRGKLRELSDLGHNLKQFRICLTPSNSKNVQRVLAFLSEDKFYVDINTNQLIHCSCTSISFQVSTIRPLQLADQGQDWGSWDRSSHSWSFLISTTTNIITFIPNHCHSDIMSSHLNFRNVPW